MYYCFQLDFIITLLGRSTAWKVQRTELIKLLMKTSSREDNRACRGMQTKNPVKIKQTMSLRKRINCSSAEQVAQLKWSSRGWDRTGRRQGEIEIEGENLDWKRDDISPRGYLYRLGTCISIDGSNRKVTRRRTGAFAQRNGKLETVSGREFAGARGLDFHWSKLYKIVVVI